MKTETAAAASSQQLSEPVLNPGSISDTELLARLLYPGDLRKQKLKQARSLLKCFGGLRGLQAASRMATQERKGLDDQAAERLGLANELVHRQLKQSLQRGVSLTSPAITIQYLQTALRDRRREIFTCLFLDTRHRVSPIGGQ
jgi:DNA repair protein RadC